MRLPITPQLSTKDGTANKNARLTNALREKDKAVARPGLSLVLDYAGVGNGLVPWNDRLIGLFDDTVYDFGAPGTGGTGGGGGGDAEETGGLDFNLNEAVGTPSALAYSAWTSDFIYPDGGGVTYGGTTYFSTKAGNIAHTPSADSGWWLIVWPRGDWDPEVTYAIGESALVNDVRLYSIETSNVGEAPTVGALGNGLFWSTSPTVTTWKLDPAGLLDISGETPQVVANNYAAWFGVDASPLPVELLVDGRLAAYYNWSGADPNPHAGGSIIIRA